MKNTNYNMLPQIKYTPELIVENNINFSIPLYQRLFAWGEDQVKGLMTDLIDHFFNDNSKDKPYYLGQMTIVKQGDRYALIDGQQRCTVMTLFAIALLQCKQDLGIKDNSNWLGFCLSGERLNFKGRSEDNNYIEQLINNKKLDYENPHMAMAIGLMKEMMPKEYLVVFGERVFKNLSFFFAELDESYVRNPASLNKYFEAMNSTGKGLEQHEILKVELMRNQPKQDVLTRIWNLVSRMDKLIIPKKDNHAEQGEYDYIIGLCREYKYEEALGALNHTNSQEENDCSIDCIQPSNIEPNERRSSDVENAIISFPKFLLLVLDLTGCYTGGEMEKFYRPANLNTLFKRYKPINIMAFYGELLHYRLLLDYYCVHMEYTQNVSKHVLTIYDVADTESTVCLKQYLSMLNVSTIYHNWLKPYLQAIHNSTHKMTVSDLLMMIKTIDDNIKEHELPESIDLMSYNELKRKRYLFWRLDYYLFENRSKYFKTPFGSEANLSAINNYEFRENRSIEHLHPQDETNNDAWEDYDLNNFGNLAMISQSFNSEQSNDPVEVKFARIKEQAKYSELQSLKMYLMYLIAGTKPEGWSEPIAEEHGKVMFNFIKQTYKTENENMINGLI